METGKAPLVSCIMLTRDRRRFANQAIWYFLRQDYPTHELIIVDDGRDPINDLIPSDNRIRYIRLDAATPIGTKLNLACSHSRGDLIAHWEDDDWMAPDRLRTQVARLLQSDMEATRPVEILHYWMAKGQAWLYHSEDNVHFRMTCGPVLYRRSAWQKRPFEDSNGRVVSPFPRGVHPEKILIEPDAPYYVKLIHTGNANSRNLRDAFWHQRSLAEVSGRLANDIDFYATLRNPAISRPVPPITRVSFAAPFMVYDGYGSVAQYIALGMLRSGALVDIIPFKMDRSGMREEFLSALDRSTPAPHSTTLCFCWPREDLSRFQQTSNLFCYTMWESSRLPSDWYLTLNRMRAVFVPTRYVAQVFRDSGVQVPVEVVPQGVDPEVYHYEERPERIGITTLTVGTFVPRKNIEIGIEAWKKAFEDHPEARLIIKSRFRVRPYQPDDPRITFIDTEEPTHGIAHWYRQADVLLALGNEGFGLPLVEGMATGLPVIALDAEGQADVCREAGDCLLPVAPHQWVPHNQAPFGDCGMRAVPSPDHVAEKLRWVADHRDAARAMGKVTSEWVLKNRNIWKTGPRLLELMEQLARPPQPLRRRRTLWVSSWNTSCGISEYTMHLSRELNYTSVCGKLPDLRAVSLLHVQHEYGILPESEMMSALRTCRERNIPTVVTMHTVIRESRAWEHYADTLVSLSRRGEDWLHRRHPYKSVAYIPHGCPTWFPPRKRKRGKVIGAFGFLDATKGFWELLHVLRKLPGTELLLFSYAKSADTERRWEKAAEGLSVRRECRYLPSEDIAVQLAAEADILVYWYGEIDHASTSGAARIGLATGVPVLTSRSAMFDDLREAVYQSDDLVEGIAHLLDDTLLRQDITAAAREYCFQYNWKRIAAMHEALWETTQNQGPSSCQ